MVGGGRGGGGAGGGRKVLMIYEFMYFIEHVTGMNCR